MIQLTFAFLILFSTAVMAGDKGGNGGDGILCSSSVLFYDLFEAENVHGMTMNLPSIELSEKERLKSLFARIGKLNPTRELKYNGWLDSFYSEVVFTDNDLIDVPDTGDGQIPAGCELKQIIIQREPRFPNQKRYTIARRYWNMMDADSKVAAIAHEIILRDNLSTTNEDSINVRYFNGKMMEDGLPKNLKGYLELLELLNLGGGEVNGFPVLTRGLVFYNENSVKRAMTEKNILFDYRGGKASFTKGELAIVFYETGKLHALFDDLWISEKVKFEMPVGIILPETAGFIDIDFGIKKDASDPFGFRSFLAYVRRSSAIDNTNFCLEHPLIRTVGGDKNLCGVKQLEFHYNGNLRFIVTPEEGLEAFINGKWTTSTFEKMIYFSLDGSQAGEQPFKN